MEQELARWEEFAFEGIGAAAGAAVNLIPTVKNDTEEEREFLVAVIVGTVGALGVWSTEPTMAKLSYPGGEDAAATGRFTFAPGEEKECPLEFQIPEDAPPKTYNAWIMVFHDETRVAEKKLGKLPVG